MSVVCDVCVLCCNKEAAEDDWAGSEEAREKEATEKAVVIICYIFASLALAGAAVLFIFA